MKTSELTDKEKLLLYGLVRYPQLTDKQLSEKIGLKHSTISSIRRKLKEKDYFRMLRSPMLQHLGCQILGVIYTNFSPLVPLEERVDITRKTVEGFDEIFLSVNDDNEGFSLSFAQEYSTIGKIIDFKTQMFGGRGLLEGEYPNMVVFPFEISKMYRFFDFAPLLKKRFEIEFEADGVGVGISHGNMDDVSFSEKEKEVYCMLVRYPELLDSVIGTKLNVSRHTVSRLRRGFENNRLIKRINLPYLEEIGFDILTLFHVRFNPSNPPDMEKDEAISLISDSTVFMASRMFEAVILSIYTDYNEFKKDYLRIMQVLKENNWIADDPLIQIYSLNTSVFVRDFKFAPLVRKITGGG